MTISFFGHSKLYYDSYEKIFVDKLKSLAENNELTCYIGGYGNFDDFALKCCRELKKGFASITTVKVLAYYNEKIADERFDEIYYPELEKIPKRLAIIKRNEIMIDESDYIFFFVAHCWGGAYTALEYERKKKKKYCNIANL